MSLEEALQSCDLDIEQAYTHHVIDGALVRWISTIVPHKDIHTAEDVAQETFQAMLKNRGGYIECGKLTQWMQTIARNKARDLVRTQQRRGRHDDIAFDPEPLVEEDPDRKIRRDEVIERILPLFDTLRPDQRTCLELSVFHGMSHQEIADALNIGPRTAQSRIRLACEKLLGELKALNLAKEDF